MKTFEAENLHRVKMRLEFPAGTFHEKEIVFPLYETAAEAIEKWDAVADAGGQKKEQYESIRVIIQRLWPELPPGSVSDQYADSFLKYLLNRRADAKKTEPA